MNAEHSNHRDRSLEEGQQDLRENLPVAASVDTRSLLELEGQGHEELTDQERAERAERKGDDEAK